MLPLSAGIKPWVSLEAKGMWLELCFGSPGLHRLSDSSAQSDQPSVPWPLPEQVVPDLPCSGSPRPTPPHSHPSVQSLRLFSCLRPRAMFVSKVWETLFL